MCDATTLVTSFHAGRRGEGLVAYLNWAEEDAEHQEAAAGKWSGGCYVSSVTLCGGRGQVMGQLES